MSQGRVAPEDRAAKRLHDWTAERRLVGTLLSTPQPRLGETLAVIQDEAVTDPQARRCLAGVRRMAGKLAEGESIDGPELVEAVALNGDWAALTGWIARAAADAYAPRNLRRVTERLNRLAARRAVSSATHRLLSDIEAGTVELPEAQAALGEVLSANLAVESGRPIKPPPELRPVLVNLATIEAEAVDWLWDKRMARRSITLLSGRPGQGKSMVTVDLMARVTTGRGWPNEPPHTQHAPANVICVAIEDSLPWTLRPRLDLACGDAARVTVLQVVADRRDEEHLFQLERDAPGLRDAVARVGDVALVVIDPIGSCMGGQVDSHRHTEVYAALTPLRALAEETGCAVLAVHHHSKAPSGKGAGAAMDAVMGSVAFGAVSRNIWSCMDDPDDPTVRLFAHAKSNLSALQDALRYEIREDAATLVGYVVWHAQGVHVTADQVVAANRERADGRRKAPGKSELDRAVAWIRETLADGPLPSSVLTAGAKAAGISGITLVRAREQAKVVSIRQNDAKGLCRRWLCQLPDFGEQ